MLNYQRVNAVQELLYWHPINSRSKCPSGCRTRPPDWMLRLARLRMPCARKMWRCSPNRGTWCSRVLTCFNSIFSSSRRRFGSFASRSTTFFRCFGSHQVAAQGRPAEIHRRCRSWNVQSLSSHRKATGFFKFSWDQWANPLANRKSEFVPWNACDDGAICQQMICSWEAIGYYWLDLI